MNKKPSFFKQLVTRWNATSPKFWKTIKKWAIGIGSSAVAVIGADKMFDLQGYGVDNCVFVIASYIVVFCFAVGLSAQITKKDNADEL